MSLPVSKTEQQLRNYGTLNRPTNKECNGTVICSEWATDLSISTSTTHDEANKNLNEAAVRVDHEQSRQAWLAASFIISWLAGWFVGG